MSTFFVERTEISLLSDVRTIRATLLHIPPYLSLRNCKLTNYSSGPTSNDLVSFLGRLEIEPLIAKYEIPRRLINLFKELRDFEIALVIDGSWSWVAFSFVAALVCTFSIDSLFSE